MIFSITTLNNTEHITLTILIETGQMTIGITTISMPIFDIQHIPPSMTTLSGIGQMTLSIITTGMPTFNDIQHNNTQGY
jgi:hypothetical protein